MFKASRGENFQLIDCNLMIEKGDETEADERESEGEREISEMRERKKMG